MSHIIIVRAFKPSDEAECKRLITDNMMSSLNTTFRGMLFKEIIFQMIILSSAIMFIFFEMQLTICLSLIPVTIVLTYIVTYISFALKRVEINREVSNILRFYMSNAFSYFWVAVAFEPSLMTQNSKDTNYIIMIEQEFYKANIDVSLHTKTIVGTVGLSKNDRLEKGAWMKRLCAHEQYQDLGIAEFLVNTAVQFARDAGYSCVNVVASEYMEKDRELFFKKEFELKQMYHKPILGSLLTILMYELSYQIKPKEKNITEVISWDTKECLNHSNRF